MLYSSARAGPDAAPDWQRRSNGILWCSHCRSLNRTIYPLAIDCELRSAPCGTWSIGVPFRADVPIYRSSLTKQLDRDLTRSGFVFGRCLRPRGQVVDNYATMYSRNYVVLRGDTETITKVCAKCGDVWTDLVTVFAGRPAYVMRHQLSDATVYQGRAGKLLVTREVAARIDWTAIPDVRVARIDVRETPLDHRHLPGDPAWGDQILLTDAERRESAIVPTNDFPEGTPVDTRTEISSSLIIRSQTLMPEELTDILGCEPSFARSARSSSSQLGVWEVRSTAPAAASFQSHLNSIISRLSAESSVWHRLSSDHELELVAIIYLGHDEPQTSVSPAALAWLGERMIRLSIRWDHCAAQK